MKTIGFFLKWIPCLALFAVVNFSSAFAQETKKDRQNAKKNQVTDMVNLQRFVFVAQYVLPFRGGSRRLTSDYSLSVTRDTIVSYLPFFGRAYSAPLNSTDLALDYTSTDFQYSVKPGKKDSWTIIMKPKSVANVQQLTLQVFTNGSASLNVTSLNRDPISYRGIITGKK